MSTEPVALLQDYFGKPGCLKATGPLRKGLEIDVDLEGQRLHLKKNADRVDVLEGPGAQPDMTVVTSAAAITKLTAAYSDDVGEIGVAILKQMTSSDPTERIRVKLHIGLWDFIRGGYLGVLPLGGPSVMKFLASKGLGGIGKIKEAISKLREER